MTGTSTHASLVAIGARGVLILGEARSGKSALALCLMRLARREGHEAALVGDDQLLLWRQEQKLVGRVPPSIAGMMEISGVGIVPQPTVPESYVDLVVQLSANPPRMPESEEVVICGLAIRQLHLPSREAVLGAEIILEMMARTAT